MTSIPLARSESAGGAVRSPEGGPPRRLGQTWECGDVGGRATPDRQPLAVAAIVGNPITSPDEGAKFTLVPEAESLTRGSDDLPLVYASGLSTPTSARRESADNDVSRSTMLTTCADLQTQYMETHTNVNDLTSTKQSAQGPLKTTRANIAQTKDRRTDLKVDSAVQSTYLQRGVSQLRPAETQMAPHPTSDKDPQTLFGATAHSWRHLLPLRCNRLMRIASHRIGLRFPRHRF